MQTKYKGILIYTKVYKDNDLLIKFLSDTDEIISGIVYGGLSRRKKNLLQLGFFLNFYLSTKSNRPPSINVELCEPYISKIIDDKYKLNCLMTITSLINLSIIEGQKINNIFNICDNFLLKMINNKRWLIEFLIFLFNLLKIIGYEIEYSNNTKYKYFDLELLEFTKFQNKSSVSFPFSLLNNENNKIETQSLNTIFEIFETVFSKYHLYNFNLRLPNQYHLFKKLILNYLKN